MPFDTQLKILRDFCYPDFMKKFNRILRFRKNDNDLDPLMNEVINAFKGETDSQKKQGNMSK